MIYNINISEEENSKIEYLHYSYNAVDSLLKILLDKSEISEQFLNSKFQERNEIYKSLEKEKNIIANKYKPDKNKLYNCLFDFTNKQIIFEEP